MKLEFQCLFDDGRLEEGSEIWLGSLFAVVKVKCSFFGGKGEKLNKKMAP